MLWHWVRWPLRYHLINHSFSFRNVFFNSNNLIIQTFHLLNCSFHILLTLIHISLSVFNFYFLTFALFEEMLYLFLVWQLISGLYWDHLIFLFSFDLLWAIDIEAITIDIFNNYWCILISLGVIYVRVQSCDVYKVLRESLTKWFLIDGCSIDLTFILVGDIHMENSPILQ